MRLYLQNFSASEWVGSGSAAKRPAKAQSAKARGKAARKEAVEAKPQVSTSTADTGDSDVEHYHAHAGDMAIVRNTLKGIAAHDVEEGRISFGKHAECIRMGRDLWETPELTAAERLQAKERFFDDGVLPDSAEALKGAQSAVRLDDERPRPFEARTQPYAHLTVVEYDLRI